MIKKFILIFILLLSFSSSFGQAYKIMNPNGFYSLDFSEEGEKKHQKHLNKCDELWGKETLTEQEKSYVDNCDEMGKGYWDVEYPGCSWYCGGGPDSITASSFLPNQKNISYSFENIHDLNYKTAWVEGVKGYGIGEYIIYHFSPQSPRITDIFVVNGYVKSEKAWRENSRVKQLTIYINDKPFALLNLKNTRGEQQFSFEPIGKFSKTETWTMKFEITDIYKGEKYDDTVISEIYFDGIDVH